MTRSASSATGSPDRCCRLLLPEDQKGRFPDGEPAFDLGGLTTELVVTCGYGCSAEGCSRVKRADLPAFWVVMGWFRGTRASLVRAGAWVPGVILAQPSARAISARDRASSSAASSRSRRALANQGA